MKRIKREFSVARTPQQIGVAERKNRTLIEVARTMLADSLLPTTFWAEAVNTTCYVQNIVLVTKPNNKTPYELLIGRSPNLEFMRPFGCPVIILNTLDHPGKFNGKVDEGNKPNVAESGPEWLFDIDSLTKYINYEPVFTGNQSNGDAGIQIDIHAGQASQEKTAVHEYILLPFISFNPPLFSTIQSSYVNDGDQPGDVNAGDIQGGVDEISRNDDVCQGNKIRIDSSTHAVNAASTSINTASNIIAADSLNINTADSNHINMPTLEATRIFNGAFDDRDLGVEADTNNLDSSTVFSHIPTTRVNKDHLKEHIIRDPNLNTQTRRMINFSKETAMFSFINKKRRTNHKDLQNCLFACFLSQMELKKMDVKSAFLYRKIKEEVYVYQQPGFEDLDFPDKVYKVKKALYGLHQAPRAWYETLSTYLLNNGFKRGQIDKTLFIKRNKGDILLVQVYVDDIICGSTKKETCDAFEILMHEKFQMTLMGELTFFLGLQVKQKQDDLFIKQDKYVAEILKKFGFSEVKTASTPMETLKPLLKDEDGQEVDVHIYRSMIGSLMYLTSSRPDIIFAVCACARHQVSPKVSYLHTVKSIFRYLKGQPKLGLWYPKDFPFDLEAYTDSDYAGSSLDRKSTTGVCQFLSCRLISW
nr:uncharacterized mitochondrial protein AtMg00810-like [Tanacetum cinerariifolium]